MTQSNQGTRQVALIDMSPPAGTLPYVHRRVHRQTLAFLFIISSFHKHTRLRRNVGWNGHNFRKNGVTRFFS